MKIVTNKVTAVLTVLFEGPFWIGVYERIAEGKLTVCKITFGPEPKDYEVYDFLLNNHGYLQFSPPVPAIGAEADSQKTAKQNPKRVQREIHRQVSNTGVGTKAQQALKLQQEQSKLERRSVSREQKEARKQRQFELKQQKKKEKHRGR